ncbi:MAG: hypothetical protein E7434_01585 [Ruminococcaceae bacterium]|nr:hypothetical protein [Oscillospiraceae bacterium]
MMDRRGLIVGNFDTAKYGFTMSKLSLSTPQAFEDWVEVEGMDGCLDFSEAAAGYPLYQIRRLEAVFELSEGNLASREMIITEFIRSVHGKKCTIIHPNHGGKLLKGRVQLSKDFSNLAHAQVTLTAVCQPWFLEPHRDFLELPILDRSHNRITYTNTEFLAELSSCEGGTIGDTESVTVSLVTTAASIHTYAVFRVTLEANETYYLSGRMLNKGYWRASNAPQMPDAFSPIVQTGQDGYLYIFVVRLQSYAPVNLLDIVCVPSYEAQILKNGSFPTPLLCSKNTPISVLVSVNGVSKMHHTSSPELYARSGDIPVLAFRHDTSDEESYETISFERRWLE